MPPHLVRNTITESTFYVGRRFPMHDADRLWVRLHDLRHSVALGRSTPAVTDRYSHLYLSTLRSAVETVGEVVALGSRR